MERKRLSHNMPRSVAILVSFAVSGLLMNAGALLRVYERTTPGVLQPAVRFVLEKAAHLSGASEMNRVRVAGEDVKGALGSEGSIRDAQGKRFLLVGDSMMEDLAKAIDRQLRDRGASSASVIRRGSTLGGDLWGWEDDIAAMVKRSKADVVIVLLDAESKNVKEYANTVEGFASTALAAGAKQVVWLERPLCDDAGYEKDHALRHAGLRAADAELSGLVVIDEGSSVMPSSGAYGAWITRVDGERVRVRQEDGVHLTIEGARILAAAVLDRLGV